MQKSVITDDSAEWDWYTCPWQTGRTDETAVTTTRETLMSAMTPADDEAIATVMTGSERAAMLERLVQACTTSVVAPVGASRNRAGHSTRSLVMWRCQ